MSQTHQTHHPRWPAVAAVLVALYPAAALITSWQRMPPVSDSLIVPLTMAFNLIWVGLFVAWVIIRLRYGACSAHYGTWLWISFAIYSLLRLALFARADYDQGRLPFLFILLISCLAAVAISKLRSSRPDAVKNQSDNHQ